MLDDAPERLRIAQAAADKLAQEFGCEVEITPYDKEGKPLAIVYAYPPEQEEDLDEG